jgi:hypothetical protein
LSVTVHELTSSGAGGVSVLSVEGAGALAQVEAWCGVVLEVGVLRLVRVEVGGERLDEALVCPFTPGRVEVHVTGSPPLVRRLVEECSGGNSGATENLEQRAQALLARAPGEAAARILLDQAEGALRRELEQLQACDGPRLRDRAAGLASRALALRPLLEPPRVLLAGPVNSGKSTLFNLLVGGERAICSDEAGTTRDLLSEAVRLGPWTITLLDGAGARVLDRDQQGAALEAAGQATVLRAARSVDLVLWLDPPDACVQPPVELAPLVRLGSRGDLVPGDPGRLRPIEEPAAALATVEAVLCRALALPEETWLAGEPVAFDALTRALVGEVGEMDLERAQQRIARALSSE